MTGYYVGWAVLVVYLAGFLPAWYLAAKTLLASEDFGGDPPYETEDVIMAVVVALVAAAAWPLALAIWGMGRLVTRRKAD